MNIWVLGSSSIFQRPENLLLNSTLCIISAPFLCFPFGNVKIFKEDAWKECFRPSRLNPFSILWLERNRSFTFLKAKCHHEYYDHFKGGGEYFSALSGAQEVIMFVCIWPFSQLSADFIGQTETKILRLVKNQTWVGFSCNWYLRIRHFIRIISFSELCKHSDGSWVNATLWFVFPLVQ